MTTLTATTTPTCEPPRRGGEGLQEGHNWSIPIAPGVARLHPVGVSRVTRGAAAPDTAGVATSTQVESE
jgi:hypothetical protein